MFRVGVDVGGTFTDICVFDDVRETMQHAKVPTSADPVDAIVAGLTEIGVDLSETALVSHGTTVTTNALIARTFPLSAMITTEGFRDVIEIRRGTKPDLWDAYADVAPPYIRRRDRLTVAERLDHTGAVVLPLDEEQARSVARIIKKRGFLAVAICFINSYANPRHEQRMGEILREECPDLDVSLSSEVLPEIFEHERFSTTVINAVVGPLVGRYVRRLDDLLRNAGSGGDLVLIHSGGGMLSAKTAARFGARLASSGIAAGAVAGKHIAEMSGFENAICLDMGGTSTDISLMAGGDLKIAREWSVEYGYPICFPSIEILTIGAGGGSIGWVDAGGALKCGPQSAGADPGPAAYGRGGDAPTTTDANLVLGRLGRSLADGAIHLDRDAAERSVSELGTALGLDAVETALALVEVANAKMVDALRLISVRKGYDPREFALIVFGGAGPLHAVDLARELGMPSVVVPPSPGLTSALGCLLVDVRHDLSRMFFGRLDSVATADIEHAFVPLEAEARERLRLEGIPATDVRLDRSIDMRYVGQWRSIAISVASPLVNLRAVVEAFHREHEREHAYSDPRRPIEIYRLNVCAIGVTPKPSLSSPPVHADADRVPHDHRPVMFDRAGGWISTPVYRRVDLDVGVELTGPAVIEELDSTVLVPPGVQLTVDHQRSIRMELQPRPSR